MARLMVIVALAFTALVAFASAHRPIISTTVIEELGSSVYSKQQCSRQLQGQRFNRCLTYISNSSKQNGVCCIYTPPVVCWPCMISRDDQQGQELGLEQCCNELEQVEEGCQCEALQEVYSQAQQQQWSQQGGRQQQPQTRDLQQIVQNIRNQCNLQVQQCQIPYATMF